MDRGVRHAVHGLDLRKVGEGKGALRAVREVIGQRDRLVDLVQVCRSGRCRLPAGIGPRDEALAGQPWVVLSVHQAQSLGEERLDDLRPAGSVTHRARPS